LLETIKRAYTKQLKLALQPGVITPNQIDFLQKNMKSHPGKSRLKMILFDQVEKLLVELRTIEKGFEMNDEMTAFLEKHPEIEVKVDIL
jgi:DNA polymerase-3 subunit alpha